MNTESNNNAITATATAAESAYVGTLTAEASIIEMALETVVSAPSTEDKSDNDTHTPDDDEDRASPVDTTADNTPSADIEPTASTEAADAQATTAKLAGKRSALNRSNLSEKKIRRLEKNRLSARECRRRKKEAAQQLEQEIHLLERENLRLRLQLKVCA